MTTYDIRPPEAFPHTYLEGEDQWRYIKRPDIDFFRPELENPGGSKFIWPLGIEGVEFQSQAQIGIHHYIGDNDFDVDVVYPDEEHITMTGMFPGFTGAQNVAALRKVLLEPAPDDTKKLTLPLVTTAAVKVVSQQFTKDSSDNSGTFAYSLEFVVVGGVSTGVNAFAPLPAATAVPLTGVKKGTTQRIFTVTQGGQTLKSIAARVYGNPNQWQQLLNLNKDKLEVVGISPFALAYAVLAVGTKLEY